MALTKCQEKAEPVAFLQVDENIKNAKLCYDRLVMVFGNDPKRFKPFLAENHGLSPKEAVAKFAEINYNWTPQELQYFEIEGKLKRVGMKMGKNA